MQDFTCLIIFLIIKHIFNGFIFHWAKIGVNIWGKPKKTWNNHKHLKNTKPYSIEFLRAEMALDPSN